MPEIDINRLGRAIEEIINARLEKEGAGQKVKVTLERSEEDDVSRAG